MLILTILIPVSSPGSPFFVSLRVGAGGKEFRMYKFRSMYSGSHDQYFNVRADTTYRNGPLYKNPRDPRITPLGALIRRLSLDELPQLMNVLFGQMSLVGPRPAFEVEIREMGNHGQRRLEVLPGMTGLCQISGRSELPFGRCVVLERLYLLRASWTLDSWILVNTIRAVLKKAGAH